MAGTCTRLAARRAFIPANSAGPDRSITPAILSPSWAAATTTAVPPMDAPMSTIRREPWWRAHFAAAATSPGQVPSPNGLAPGPSKSKATTRNRAASDRAYGHHWHSEPDDWWARTTATRPVPMLTAARRSKPGPCSRNIARRSRLFRQTKSAAPMGVGVADALGVAGAALPRARGQPAPRAGAGGARRGRGPPAAWPRRDRGLPGAAASPGSRRGRGTSRAPAAYGAAVAARYATAPRLLSRQAGPPVE